MFVSIKVNIYSFAAILCVCAFFFWGVFSNSAKLAEALALTEPSEAVKIEPGQIQAVRKIERMNVIFPTIKVYVDYSYERNGRVKNYSFHCRSVSACRWLDVGPAEILVADNGRYALPAALRDKLKAYKIRLRHRIRTGGIMSLLTMGLTIFFGIQLFRR